MGTPDVPGPKALTEADRQWVRDLADALVTVALAMVVADDVSETEALYAAVRTAALEVRTDDHLAAERWLLAMFSLASRSAGLLGRLAMHEDLAVEATWQSVVLETAR